MKITWLLLHHCTALQSQQTKLKFFQLFPEFGLSVKTRLESSFMLQ